MNNIKNILITTYLNVQDSLTWYLSRFPAIHKLLFAPGIEDRRHMLGKLRLIRTHNFAAQKVPAYRAYLRANNSPLKLDLSVESIEKIPEMDKESYIKKYSNEKRTIGGKLPTRGVIVDESSGSSGTPTSWVRGADERRMVSNLMRFGLSELTDNRPIFVLNAFALGAWATGMLSTIALVDISIIKSTGPDQKKIIDTMQEFGPKYHYVILGYPPFLRSLSESTEIDWSKYNTIAIFGGEAMSESMRKYLLKTFSFVGGSYGASDLEINIAHETKLTMDLRKKLVDNSELAQILGIDGEGAVPMIFQYNPYDYVIETNKNNELLISIARKNNINPRLRYNIHDVGFVMHFSDLKKRLEHTKYSVILDKMLVDLPLLFYYGRSDLSLNYYGAIVNPEAIRQTIYKIEYANQHVETFRLISVEDKNAQKHLQFALELKADSAQPDDHTKDIVYKTIIEDLRNNNGDFKQALSIAKVQPTIMFYDNSSGPFSVKKLKASYIWELEFDDATEKGVIL